MEQNKKSLLATEINADTIKAVLDHFKNKKRTKLSADETPAKRDSITEFSPRVPEVDLVPTPIRELYAAQDTKKKFFYAGTGLALAFAAIFGVTLFSAHLYETEIAEINAATEDHRSEIQSLRPYVDYRNAVESKRSELNDFVSGYLDLGRVNEDFQKAVRSAGYQVDSMSVSGITSGEAEAANCVNPDPFSQASGVGCITFTLSGNGNLGQLYNAMNSEDNGFLNVFVPSVTKSQEGKNSVDGSVAVDSSYEFDRYRYLATPLDEILRLRNEPPMDETETPETSNSEPTQTTAPTENPQDGR